MKKLLLLIFLLIPNIYAFHDGKITEDYKKERKCIAALSIARDVLFDNGLIDKYKLATNLQNKLYLMHPQSHFPTKHIQAEKVLIKAEMEKQGTNYLTEDLMNLCQNLIEGNKQL